METTTEQQVAMDEALVPSAQRCPFYKAFLVIADVPEIYMQEFFATANVHQHSIRFKMDNKKHILDLESFRNILHICPRVQGQSFAELPFEEEILDFIRFLGHSATIRTLTHSSAISSSNLVRAIPQEECRLCFPDLNLSIPRRNKVNWHYVRDDFMFSMIKLVSRHQNTQQFAPKPKASARRTKSGSDTSITPPTATATPRPTAAATPRLTAAAKGKKQPKHPKPKPGGSGTDEGTGSKPRVPDVPTDESEEELLWNSTYYEGADDEGKDDDDDEDDERDDDEEGEEDDDDENKDGDVKDDADEDQKFAKHDDKDDTEESEDDDEEGESDEHESDKETREEESFDPIPQTPEDSENEDDGEEDLDLNIGEEERHNEEEKEDELYRDTPTSVAHLSMTIPTMTSSTIATTITTSQAPTLPTTIPSNITQNLPNFALLFRFDYRLRSLEQNFSEVMQTNQFAGAVSAIPRIIQHYMDQRMNEVVQVAIQLQSDRLREEAQKENDEFLRTVDENIKKIIKEQVKEQVKAQVSKILPRIEQAVNKQLEAEVLTRSSHSSRTSYAVAADLSEMELKKILIEKMERNKSIQRSDAQRNLYKALVDACESKNIILDTYGETITLKRRRDDDEDKDEEPFAGPDRGSKRRREGKKPESAITPSETATKSAGRSTTRYRSRQVSASESAFANEPLQTTSQMEEPSHLEFETCADDQPIVKSSQHPEWFPHLKKPPSPDRDWNKTLPTPLPLIPDNRGRRVIPFAHFINNDLEYLRGGTNRLQQACPLGSLPLGRKRQQFYGFAVNRESARNVYSKRRIIAVTELKILEWHSYKHLDWIIVRRDDDKLYKFKEGDFKRLRVQDIEDMLLLLVQSKLTNLTVKERFAFNNKDKQNRLMRIDELHKFSDGTLTDVRTALDDRLKGIRMQYLPQTIWRRSNKDKAEAMIQAIDKRLKTRRVMRSLERFVGGRLYEDTSGCYKGPYQLSYVDPIFQEISLTYAGNPIKKILPKLNLSDHRSILTDLQVTPTKP
uniref:Uncharacterized protein n=1 Tax=Tanacetum cinerariifolium TaxID=118510 RepID=A0A6L2LZ25_TANCI|nr:hypothetical protein [Tanacetum cinerariifolium]